MKFTAWLLGMVLLAGSASADEVKAEIKVSGMTCGACAVSVKRALTKLDGVKSAEVSHQKQLAVVVYDDSRVSEAQLREAINKTGFKAEPAQRPKDQRSAEDRP